ncbi:MAG TPA: BadF/BadG/BcrA/BcrD ATPase family protein [Xanthobacteraceae bacterium]|nr:BadF/BadG/BcrA/BcrD ATPase family protein [Xanthobacteraceae bacterium]
MTARDPLLLAVDGGGTRCSAQLATFSGNLLGEAVGGPANLRLGVDRSFATVVGVASACLKRATLPATDAGRIVACLALAGASEPTYLAAARAHQHPFRKAIVTTDAHAACVGAHGQADGGIIIAGTGTVGWATVKGRTYRVGGWGLPISDEGSGAWAGCEALRRVLWANDGRIAWTPMLQALFGNFGCDPHAIVSWSATASPADFGGLAPHIVDYAAQGDAASIELLQQSAAHIDALAARLLAVGADRLALVGGFAPWLRRWLSPTTAGHLVEPAGDALAGALDLARAAAQPPARAA